MKNDNNKIINDDCGCGHDHAHSNSHELNHAGHVHAPDCGCGHGHAHSHSHELNHAGHVHGPDCGCGHDHAALANDDNEMKKRRNKIIVAVILFVIVFALDHIVELAGVFPGRFNWVLPFVCYGIVYLILGFEILKEAISGIIHGELLDENFLMSVASLGAFALGVYKGCIGEEPDGFEEGCAVVIFYSIGEWFQSWALGKSRKSIADLMDIRADIAHAVIDGADLNYVAGGNSGTSNFQDNTALAESSGVSISADDSALTGNSATDFSEHMNNNHAFSYKKTDIGTLYTDYDPEDIKIGTRLVIMSGEKVPIDGVLVSERAILDTMALTGESEHETPVKGTEVLSGAVNMTGSEIMIDTTKVYEDSAVAKILELVENTPERKAKAETFIARFARIYTPIVVGLAVAIAILPPLFGLITGLNMTSDLSWTTWIYRALSFLVVSCPCALVISIPLSFFMGIGTASRYHILIKGSNCLELISKANIFVSDKTGTLTVGRKVKPEAKNVIKWIKDLGAKLFVLSGDREDIVSEVAGQLNIEHYSSELKPDDKVAELEKIMNSKSENDVVVYMGDGINDAPSLIRADVGISMGNIGSDAAVEASNIVLMRDNLYGIPIIIKIAKRTMGIVKQNIVFSIGIKVIVLILSAFGITNMWVAVFADVGVALLAVLNALRVGAVKYDENQL